MKKDILNKNVVVSHKNKGNEFTRKISIEDVDKLIINIINLLKKYLKIKSIMIFH
ncbi:hypothetical protein [Mycoplasmopsis lipofaciens]|uniref:hypothetical protein n=1 Tax=Mycoplasmopsis lipofaciens TaxID=114884 RepID=UPI000AC25445|nr:hypothetical protein [Mycoplasmopsis lipofaciens]